MLIGVMIWEMQYVKTVTGIMKGKRMIVFLNMNHQKCAVIMKTLLFHLVIDV